MSYQSQILLQTKLHRLRLPQNLVVRTRLIELLNQGIDRQITLVCAPAGFGKTTLVGTWLEQMAAVKGEKEGSLPSAWLSLDENDSDLIIFLHYFISALRTIFKDACTETLGLLHAQHQPPQAVLNATFINELDELPEEFILVLDDYHTICNIEVHNLLSKLTLHWPKSLHLVLISRVSPPIPLDGYRAKGMINEIRTRDLRFTHEETAAYVSKSQFALMMQYILPLLEERFEGWPAGLHLVALSIRSAESQEAVVKAISSENPNITGYLVDEVLTHQFPVVHSFLLRTCILDRFCASLCKDLIGEGDTKWNARACLDWIERAELFIVPLDDHREWYRYHHFFQELLQERLIAEMLPDQVTTLHRLASTWFDQHGMIDEALHHALAAGDLDLAARYITAGLREVINHEDRPTLERWLRLLPDEMIQHHPELLMLRAWSLQFTWRLALQIQVIRQIEELLESGAGEALSKDDRKILRGQLLLPKAQQAYFSNQQALSIELCNQVLAIMPQSWTFVRGGAMIYLGMSMQARGQYQEAERVLLDAFENHSDKNDTFALFVLESLGFIYLNSGQLDKARQITQVLVQRSIHSGLALMKLWGYWILGLVCYYRNELEAAGEYFTQIYENRYIAQISPFRDAVAGLALIHQIKGEKAEALQMVETISQFDLEQSGSVDNRTQSLRTRIMLLQGDLERAGNWLHSLPDQVPDQPFMWLEEPNVTRAHILVSKFSDTNPQLAMKIIDTLAEIADRTHNTRFKIQILAMRSLVLDAQGKSSEADGVVDQALDLARLGGFIRVFVDLGKPMQAILLRLARKDHPSEIIHRILAAFPDVDNESTSDRGRSQSIKQPISGNLALADPLTHRELEILELLRGQMSIKEIALRLNIQYSTAKRYTVNIYSKLGVNQRWSAVAKAEELNILLPR
jgi:LuxR family transcriptional regulator, maltose regulon positive regulatory protein